MLFTLDVLQTVVAHLLILQLFVIFKLSGALLAMNGIRVCHRCHSYSAFNIFTYFAAFDVIVLLTLFFLVILWAVGILSMIS